MVNRTISPIAEARKIVENFLGENIEGENIKVVKLEKDNLQWQATAEAYEDDSFLKAMNLPTKKSRVFFSVKLDEDLEVIAFERLGSSE